MFVCWFALVIEKGKKSNLGGSGCGVGCGVGSGVWKPKMKTSPYKVHEWREKYEISSSFFVFVCFDIWSMAQFFSICTEGFEYYESRIRGAGRWLVVNGKWWETKFYEKFAICCIRRIMTYLHERDIHLKWRWWNCPVNFWVIFFLKKNIFDRTKWNIRMLNKHTHWVKWRRGVGVDCGWFKEYYETKEETLKSSTMSNLTCMLLVFETWFKLSQTMRLLIRRCALGKNFLFRFYFSLLFHSFIFQYYFTFHFLLLLNCFFFLLFLCSLWRP